MPSNNQQSSSSSSKPQVQPKDYSDYKVVKDAGYDSKYHMMQSYGLKIYDSGDLDEAQQIIDGFRRIDQAQYEANKQQKK
jgi:hypothetical protein